MDKGTYFLTAKAQRLLALLTPEPIPMGPQHLMMRFHEAVKELQNLGLITGELALTKKGQDFVGYKTH